MFVLQLRLNLGSLDRNGGQNCQNNPHFKHVLPKYTTKCAPIAGCYQGRWYGSICEVTLCERGYTFYTVNNGKESG